MRFALLSACAALCGLAAAALAAGAQPVEGKAASGFGSRHPDARGRGNSRPNQSRIGTLREADLFMRHDLFALDKGYEDLAPELRLDELQPPGQVVVPDAVVACGPDHFQHTLVAPLDLVVGEMALGLDEEGRDAVVDDLSGPCASIPRITGAAGSALTGLISATLAAFSQTRARAALWSVPMAARCRRVSSSSSASKIAVASRPSPR